MCNNNNGAKHIFYRKIMEQGFIKISLRRKMWPYWIDLNMQESLTYILIQNLLNYFKRYKNCLKQVFFLLLKCFIVSWVTEIFIINLFISLENANLQTRFKSWETVVIVLVITINSNMLSKIYSCALFLFEILKNSL